MARIKRHNGVAGLPTKHLAGLPASRMAGFMLPLVIFFSILLFAIAATVSMRVKESTHQSVLTTKNMKEKGEINKGLQHGLVALGKRISFLKTRVKEGIPLTGGALRFISNADIQRYALTSPASFWTENLNNIAASDSLAAPTQPDFVLDSPSKATYHISVDGYNLDISVVSAFHLSQIEAPNSANYNNVTLRYGYSIKATEIKSGRSSTISSPIRTDQIDKLIQIHLVRELSRYNLFVENNTLSDGTPIYDRTSYSGRVYTKNTFYISGNPTYGDVFEISNLALPPFSHKDNPGFVLRKPNGVLNPAKIVEPVDLPSTLAMDSQRNMAHKMSQGQNPNALMVPGIYQGTEQKNGVDVPVSVYVNGTDGAVTKIVVSRVPPSTNHWVIQRTGDAVPTVVDQNINSVPAFLMFIDGVLYLEGTICDGSLVTINTTQNIKITNNMAYQTKSATPNTVLGLVSWNGDILVAKDVVGVGIVNLDLNAVLMTPSGGFGAEGFEDFAANYPGGYKGTIRHLGAIIGKWRRPTLSDDGTKGWGVVSNYDQYLAEVKAPPFFPGNGNYKFVDENLAKIIDVFQKS